MSNIWTMLVCPPAGEGDQPPADWTTLVCGEGPRDDEPVREKRDKLSKRGVHKHVGHLKHSGHKQDANPPHHAHTHRPIEGGRRRENKLIVTPVAAGDFKRVNECKNGMTGRFQNADPSSQKLFELMPLHTAYDVAEFRQEIELLRSTLGPDALERTVDTKGCSLLWHAIKFGDERATHALIAAGAAKWLMIAPAGTTSETDPIKLAEERRDTVLLDTLLCNALDPSRRTKLDNGTNFMRRCSTQPSRRTFF